MNRGKHQSLKSISHKVRKPESREGLKAYLIACEGECTESNYIMGLVKHQKLIKQIAIGTEVVIAPHEHSDPEGVLKDLLNVQDRERFDEAWIIIDRDEVEYKGKGFGGHSKENFNNAIIKSSQNNIKVACSNPCFELWIVLHFEFRDTACSRTDIQKRALEKVNSILPKNNQLKSIEKLKSVENIYDLLQNKLDFARINAAKIKDNESRKENPSSGMYLLLESLLK